MKRGRAIALAAVLGASAWHARAWVPMPGEVWPDGSVPVAFEFGANAPLPAAALDAAAGEAVQTWNGLLQRVQLVRIAATGNPWYDNGRNELFFDRTFYGEPFGSGVLAVTALSYEGDTRVEADIVFNANDSWAIYHGALQHNVDFRRVAVHELGHVLGLGHPDGAGQTVGAIMNSVISATELPTSDDQAGIHALYDRDSTVAPVILSGPTVDWSHPTAGMRVKWQVEVGGRGPYSYAWYRDNAAVPDGTGALLVLDPVTTSDAGNYTVQVSNAMAHATSSAVAMEVSPAQPPTLRSIYPTGYNRTAGSECTLEANDIVAGSAPMTYVWRRDGVVIGTTAYPNITLEDVQFSDGGDYTATATNIAGSVTSAPIRLVVTPGSPPQFTRDPGPLTAKIGGTLTLSANASGSGTLSYQWAKNGVAIPKATGSSFAFASFQASDAGTYTVTVTNAFGTVTSAPFEVSLPEVVLPPPVIVQHPAAVTDFAGAPAGLSVQAEGQDLEYHWFKDGAPYPAPRYQSTLTFAHLATTDAGVYTVEVSDAAGQAVSRPAKLTVLPARTPVFKQQPGPYAGLPGDTVTLSAGMQSLSAMPESWDTGEFTFHWFKDGVALTQTGPTLTISPASEADSGKYVVRATSVAGASADSHAATVVIKSGERPLIGAEMGDILYDSGTAEELRLAAVAMEVWRRRANLPGATTIALVTASGPAVATIVPGTYVAKVVQDGVTTTGTPFQIGFLPVIAPVVVRAPAPHTADLGENFSLSVLAGGNGPLSYQWSKDGAAIPGATTYDLRFPAFTAAQAGTYTVAVTSAAGTTVSEPAAVDLRPAVPPVITAQPAPAVVDAGNSAWFSVAATGGALRYQWSKNGAAIPGATHSELWLYPVGTADAGGYAVVVSNGSGLSATSWTATLRVRQTHAAPVIVCPPQNTTAYVDGDATLTVGAIGTPLPDHYQWQKDGVDIAGANDQELRLHGVRPEDAGRYTVVATNANGSVTSTAATLTVDTAGRLVNLAARAHVGTGANVLIAGFVVTGDKPRSVLVRGIGDQLSEFQVHGVLRNPLLQLFDANSTLLASSDNWSDGSDMDGDRNQRLAALRAAEKQTGAFPLAEGSRDGALIATLPPGNYSAQVSGVVSTTGIGMVEVYELGSPSADRLINMSCRSYVGTGDAVLIPGLSIHGGSPRRVLVRAVGPGLVRFGVSGALADPELTVYHGQDVIASDDDWSDQPDAGQLIAAANTVGAFPLVSGSKDAAVLLDLAPGSYTIHVKGVHDTTGVALVEVYEVP